MKELLFNQTEVAQLLNVSAKTIYRSELQPIKVEGRDKLFSLDQIINFEAERRAIDIATSDKTTDLDPGSVAYATWRKTLAQALKIERDNELSEGKTIPVDFATFCLSRVSNEIAGILDSLPMKMKRKHPELSVKAIESFKAEIAKAMNLMASVNKTTLPGIIEEYNAQAE